MSQHNHGDDHHHSTGTRMSGCCHSDSEHDPQHSASARKRRVDWLFWSCAGIVAVGYCAHIVLMQTADTMGDAWYWRLTGACYALVNQIWWGIAIGVVAMGVLSVVPREVIVSLMGSKRGIGSLLRAVGAGVLLDLCSHGILMVAAKLYERGVRNGQVMAFLIASPWNSLTLTFVLFGLIGVGWTLLFIALSIVIALITGWLYDWLTDRRVLLANSYTVAVPQGYAIGPALREAFAPYTNVAAIGRLLWHGTVQSRMVVRWLLLGIVLAAAIQTWVSAEQLQTYFGPTVIGLLLTVAAATILEVCSEGTTPIAADLFTRAHAPGNAFAFLMAGVSTDYTEILVLREVTKSLKLALFLPLLTLPQVLVIALLIQ